MSNTFEELNPVVVPSDFPNHKKVAIIMNKLLVNQYPEKYSERIEKHSLYFTKNLLSSSLRNFNSSEIKVPFTKGNEVFCVLTINDKDNLLKIEYNFDVYSDYLNEEGILQHIEDDRRFSITARSFLRIVAETDPDGNVINKFPTGDKFYSYVKFFEENRSKLTKLCLIQDFNNPKIDVSVSIPDFCKMSAKGLLDDNNLPSDDSVNTLIDDLIYMDETNVERIQAGILRITRTKGEWGTYRIYFGGTVVCNEYSLKRFKYSFHPGLSLVAKYLESEDKSESLRHKVEKEVFKKL